MLIPDQRPWPPLTIFCVWVGIMTWLLIKAVNQERTAHPPARAKLPLRAVAAATLRAVIEHDFDDTPESERPETRRAIDGPLRRTYVVFRDRFRRSCSAARAICWICDQPIDYSLKHGDPWAFELDHALPVETHPELALDPSNFKPSHSRCNKRRALAEGPSGDDGVPDTGIASEIW